MAKLDGHDPDCHRPGCRMVGYHATPSHVEEYTNTPCFKCGRTDIPLHTNGVCGECFEVFPGTKGSWITRDDAHDIEAEISAGTWL